MICEILTIGHEILQGRIVDTNSAHLGRELAKLGVEVRFRTSVGDRQRDIEEAFLRASRRASLVVATGGLGPTGDDRTREALAHVMGQPLDLVPKLKSQIEAKFRAFGTPMPDNNIKQACIPRTGRPIINPVGTAPGIRAELEGATVVCLPGVPGELVYLVAKVIPAIVREIQPDRRVLASWTMSCLGVGESTLEARIADEIRPDGEPLVGIYAGAGVVEIVVTCHGTTRAHAMRRIEPIRKRLLDRLQDMNFWEGDRKLPEHLLDLAATRGFSIATFEAGTAGELGSELAQVVFREPDLQRNLFGTSWIPGTTSVQPIDLARRARKMSGADMGIAGRCVQLESGIRFEVAVQAGRRHQVAFREYKTRVVHTGKRLANMAMTLGVRMLGE